MQGRVRRQVLLQHIERARVIAQLARAEAAEEITLLHGQEAGVFLEQGLGGRGIALQEQDAGEHGHGRGTLVVVRVVGEEGLEPGARGRLVRVGGAIGDDAKIGISPRLVTRVHSSRGGCGGSQVLPAVRACVRRRAAGQKEKD